MPTAAELTRISRSRLQDARILLHLSGRERAIKGKRLGSHWDNVSRWDPESRYNAIGSATRATAKQMIDSTRVLLREL